LPPLLPLLELLPLLPPSLPPSPLTWLGEVHLPFEHASEQQSPYCVHDWPDCLHWAPPPH
jgi:hypothetical protein